MIADKSIAKICDILIITLFVNIRFQTKNKVKTIPNKHKQVTIIVSNRCLRYIKRKCILFLSFITQENSKNFMTSSYREFPII